MVTPETSKARTPTRKFLRSVVAAKQTLEVGEPVKVRAKPRRDASEKLIAKIDGAVGFERYVSFDKPGVHRVPVIVGSPDGRIDRTEIEFEVIPPSGSRVFPILEIRQEPTNPFILYVSVTNANEALAAKARFEWHIDNYGAYSTERPFCVVDCERLVNPTDEIVPFDLHFSAVYPDGERRTAKESFRIWNDYAWSKSRGIVRPRLVYDYRARGKGRQLTASTTILNNDDEFIELTGRQIEYLFDDPDKVFVPGPLERLGELVEPRSSADIDCSIDRTDLPDGTLGWAVHFHGQTRNGHKVEASAYFEYYRYTPKVWSDVTNIEAVALLNEVKAAFAESAASASPAIPLPSRQSAAVRSEVRPHPPGKHFTALPATPFPAVSAPVAAQVSLASVRNYFEAMKPTWSPAEAARKNHALDIILGGAPIREGNADALFLGKQCLLDEEPPTDNLFCKGTGRKGQVFVPARIINGKKGDVILLPGGPLGMIGGLLQKLEPAQNFSHCGIMSGNFYKLRHATASDEWLNDHLTGTTFVAPDDVGTQGFEPESVKYIWPGTVDQTVEQAFNGSNLKYVSADGKRQKMYKIKAFSTDPSFVLTNPRHVVFPFVLKPDPLLEGDPAFGHLRPTLAEVADKAKALKGHYRFFCYSEGSISLRDDFLHRAPDRGASWWASGSRPVVCSTFILGAISDIEGKTIRLEGKELTVTEADLEKSNPPDKEKDPDFHARVDPPTRDGLYFYTEGERREAAKFVHQYIYDKAYESAGGVGTFLTDAPDDLANQVTNTFAFDYSDREFDDEDSKDSTKWENPGVGRSVSPDDMLMFWDGPKQADGHIHGLYGTHQRMVFRDGFVEEREIGTWAVREKLGNLTVTVKRYERVIAGADVKAGGQVAVTGPQGSVTIELPEGSYAIEAGGMDGGFWCDGKGSAQVRDRETTPVDVYLDDPLEFRRLVVIGGHVRIKDEENIGSDEFFDDQFTPNPSVIRLGPQARHASSHYTKKFGGEIRVEAHYDLTWNADLSITVDCNVKLFEGTSEDTNDLDGERGDSVDVLKDQENVPLNIQVTNTDEDDDDYVRLNSLISNVIDYG